MSIGSRIRELRENKHLSRNEFAEMIGVTLGAVSNYENDVSSPKEPILFKIIEVLECEPNYIFQDMVKIKTQNNDVSLAEYNHVKKYRFITEHSPEGSQVVDTVLDREYAIADKLRKQAEHITKLEETDNCSSYEDCEEAPLSNIIEFQPSTSSSGRLIKYFHSASAGTGVFILGNEVTDQIAVPDRPEHPDADYAIKVNGRSMEPDYNDGDIVLVSQRAELRHGDVGIFIVNNNAYIKEYGEHELISRNPDFDNIMIHEYDNIVCMGKVVGKLEEPYEIISL